MDYLRRVSRMGRKYIPSGEEIAVPFDHTMPDAVVPEFSEMMRSRVEANMRRADNLDPRDHQLPGGSRHRSQHRDENPGVLPGRGHSPMTSRRPAAG